MQNIHWLYLVTIILYSLSLLAYFIDFVRHNRKAHQIAFWLLSIVWLLQTVFFLLRMRQFNRLPIVTEFEGLFFYAWVVVTFSLVINKYFKNELFVFFTNIVGFIIMAFSLFMPTADIPDSLNQLLLSELSILHIALILISYSAFTLAFVFSLMYVIQHYMLKKKLWGKRLIRFSSLSRLDQLTFIMSLIGFPIFFIGIILGFVWFSIQFNYLPLFDAKIISSLIIVIAYGIYFYLRGVKSQRGYNIVLLNVACFLLVLINYFLSSNFSHFHIWK